MKNIFYKRTLVYITTLTLIATVFTSLSLNVAAEGPFEEPVDPGFEEIEWFVEGNGTYFEITNSSYLNISLLSSENVNVFLSTTPKCIFYNIIYNGPANSTLLLLSGLEPNKVYYIYENGNLQEEFVADESGSYSYAQDITIAHSIFIKEDISTIHIKADGSVVGGPAGAIVNDSSNTFYDLTMNINEGIIIERSGITFDGNDFNVQGPGWGYGLEIISDIVGVTIKNTNIAGFDMGIIIGVNANSNTIMDCTITYNIYGIWGNYNSYNNIITGNTISNNQFSGILLVSVNNYEITYNTIPDWTDGGGIYLMQSNYNTITNNILNYTSIRLYHQCIYNIITDNTISHCYYYGIDIYYSHGNIITGNNITDTQYRHSIYLSESRYNTIEGNNLSNNIQCGVFLNWNSLNNKVKGNEMSNQKWGIACSRSSSDNIIIDNHIELSTYGIGISSSANNNVIYNNYLNNSLIANAYDYGDNNIWNIDKTLGTNIIGGPYLGGNYWSDYTGDDTDGDGLGDTNIPYTSSGYIQNGGDYLPLVLSSNSPPVACAGGPYIVDEGTAVGFDAYCSSDPDDDELQFHWDFDGDGVFDTALSTDPTASFIWNDDYSGETIVEVFDGEYYDKNNSLVTVNNVAPTITFLDLPLIPIEIGTIVDLTADFTDPGFLDTHTATIDWDDGNITNGEITGSDGSYTVNGSWIYGQAGVYTISITVTDDDGGSDSMTFSNYVVVYDPGAGFVTGGGWINSPDGAYRPDPSLTGKANFGFVAKYKKGQSTPDGNTEFNFKVANMNFHSSDYDWLVIQIAGAKATYRGTGTINGEGNYGFKLTAIDEDLTPSTDTDLFRIKIWDKDNNDEIIYDNQLGDEDDSDLTTQISGGNIKIHEG